MKRPYSSGFTLAEVLITLSILGVVATMTISTIHKNYKITMTETRVRDAYFILNEITKLSYQENRSIPQNEVTTKEQDWNKYVRPYIEVQYDCGYNKTGCFAGVGGGWYSPNGVAYSTANNGYGTGSFHKVILKNGMSLAFQSCRTCLGAVRLFVVDIDGPYSGYSILGQDVFVFEWIDPKRVPAGRCRNWDSRRPPSPELVPYAGSCLNSGPAFNNNHQGGWYLDTSWNNEIERNCLGFRDGWRQENNFFQSGLGTYCAAWIARNGWRIPRRDYPWSKVNQKPANFRRP